MASLLRGLATKRDAGEWPAVRYDSVRQISEVYEDGRWTPSWSSRSLQQSKKCDHETGEDQKGT